MNLRLRHLRRIILLLAAVLAGCAVDRNVFPSTPGGNRLLPGLGSDVLARSHELRDREDTRAVIVRAKRARDPCGQVGLPRRAAASPASPTPSNASDAGSQRGRPRKRPPSHASAEPYSGSPAQSTNEGSSPVFGEEQGTNLSMALAPVDADQSQKNPSMAVSNRSQTLPEQMSRMS